MIGPLADLPAYLVALAVVGAAWRLANLLVFESGPLRIFQRLRERVGMHFYEDGKLAYMTGPVAGLFACVWCMSVWTAPLVMLLWWLIPVVVAALAVSAGAIMLEELIRGH